MVDIGDGVEVRKTVADGTDEDDAKTAEMGVVEEDGGTIWPS